MKFSFKLTGFVILVVAMAAFACGCTDSGMTTVTPTQTAAPTVSQATVTAEATQSEWMLWREGGGQTLSALGGYQAFTPNVEGQGFNNLKIEVQSDNPITVIFLTDTELNNFEKKMMTNQGEYTPVSIYENVNYQTLEASSDQTLNIVLYNPEDDIAVVSAADIWYR